EWVQPLGRDRATQQDVTVSMELIAIHDFLPDSNIRGRPRQTRRAPGASAQAAGRVREGF
ncbi:MAG: hypothetical protein ACK5SH_16685, partial [Pseudomonadota bacterium]